MKNKLITTICILVALTLSILAFAPFDCGKLDGSNWMSQLNGDLELNQVSIPGSHDSGATHSIGDVAGKCQSLSVGEQLKIGVRFFDIRLQQRKGVLHLVHSFVDQNLRFDDVVSEFSAFLDQNPTEFLLISIKEDADPVGSTVDFATAVKTALEKRKERVNFGNSLPSTVGQARGKMHILSRFNGDFGFAVHSGWRDSTSFEVNGAFVQDNYCISDENAKINDIIACFKESATQKHVLTLNFTSCYFDYGFPPLYAGSTAKIINAWLLENLDSHQGCLGVVISDFVTSELVQKVYRRNYL